MSRLASFIKLLTLFWSNGDKFVKLFNLLWTQLPVVGQTLQRAGDMAIAGSQLIKGGSGLPDGAAQVIESAAQDLGGCEAQLNLVVAEIGSIHTQMGELELPTVRIATKPFDVLFGAGGHVEVPVPTATTFHPFRDIDKLVETLTSLTVHNECLGQASTWLGLAAMSLHSLGTAMADAGTNLGNLGTDLREAGGLLIQIAGEE